MSLWDVRQPHEPQRKQEKCNLSLSLSLSLAYMYTPFSFIMLLSLSLSLLSPLCYNLYAVSPAVLREVVWPLLWGSVFVVEDSANSKLNGVHYVSLFYDHPGRRPVSQNSGPLSVSLCACVSAWITHVCGRLPFGDLLCSSHTVYEPQFVV